MTIERTFRFNPSPGECAREFASWGDFEQAEFFEHVRLEFEKWSAYQRDLQALGIAEKLGKQWPQAAALLRAMVTENTCDAREETKR